MMAIRGVMLLDTKETRFLVIQNQLRSASDGRHDTTDPAHLQGDWTERHVVERS